MNYTTNYNLKKPDYDEFAEISVLNDNADIIDEALKNASSTIQIVDNLTSTSTTAALSANQGRILNGKIPSAVSVVDNLTSTSTTSALSANQGKILDDKIKNVSVAVIDNLTSTDATKPLSANMGRALRNSNFIGEGAGPNATGEGNVAFGENALNKTTIGKYNTAIGYNALCDIYNYAEYNTAIGYRAMSGSGDHNTAIGARALYNNVSSSYNVAIGSGALQANTTGRGNVAISSMIANTTGNHNVAVGTNALRDNTTGNYNIAIGISPLLLNKTGEYNIAIGNHANSTPSPGYNNTITIGNSVDSSASNQITLGNSSITQLRCQVQTISSLSDKRIKEDIQPADTNLCLESVKSLPVSRYKFKDFTGTHLDQHVTGWMADDVEKVFPKAVQKTDEWYPELDENGEKVYEDVTRTHKEYDADGNEIEVEYTEQQEKKFMLEDVKSITMTEALPTLWGAVQALSKQVEELQAELTLIKSR